MREHADVRPSDSYNQAIEQAAGEHQSQVRPEVVADVELRHAPRPRDMAVRFVNVYLDRLRIA